MSGDWAGTPAELAASVRAALVKVREVVAMVDAAESAAFSLTQTPSGASSAVQSAAIRLGGALHSVESLQETLTMVLGKLDEVGR